MTIFLISGIFPLVPGAGVYWTAYYIVMDELGPSEAAALEFQKAVLAALDGDKPVYGVLQQADSEFLGRVAAHPRVRVVTVTEENRDRLRQQLCGEK